ncbi:type III-B CRISPR module-associated Cmr3 family protein [Nocardiopsis valliformis]|uniref:type III-B CRISPR module-associated Cmr3 family protein n=1 Tax=Nocardiopsis valliformis TaxID=239974 RepID=UPI000347403F|nr:type III-B CRISPR module-associated Cmr3 family protein [Nocardiopsis valliformis]
MSAPHVPFPFIEDTSPPEERPSDRWLLLRPHDTVQVRDGRAFDAGTGGTAQTVHPWPSTVAGALASAEGGLGGEPESVRGPVLARRRRRNLTWDPYFPVPADLVHPHGDDDVRRMTAAEPAPGVSTDLDEEVFGHGAGNLRSFAVPEGVEDPEPVTGWMSSQALREYLHGTLIAPGAKVARDRLQLSPEEPLEPETRVGLKVDHTTRTAEHGLLYSATHLRLREQWAFAAHVTPHTEPGRHLPLDEVTGPVRFGGMARLADIDPAPGLAWPERPSSFPEGRLLLYVATPGVWPRGWVPPIQGSGAELVAARMDDPLTVATASPTRSWKEFRNSRSLYYAVPPGAVYLLKFLDTDAAEHWAERHHGRALPLSEQIHRTRKINLATAGFGVVLTGVWS